MENLTRFDLLVAQHLARTERVNAEGWRRTPNRPAAELRRRLATLLMICAARLDPAAGLAGARTAAAPR